MFSAYSKASAKVLKDAVARSEREREAATFLGTSAGGQQAGWWLLLNVALLVLFVLLVRH